MHTKIEKKKGDMFVSTTSRQVTFSSENLELHAIEYRNDQSVILKTRSENLVLSKINKIAYKNQTGEEVIELSGLATDGKKEKSWAIACFEPKGYSPKHHHNERTEIYYVTAGRAKLIIDDQIFELAAGDSHVILPGQLHQIFNADEKRVLEVMVDCTPAWVYSDHHLELCQNSEQFKMDQFNFSG